MRKINSMLAMAGLAYMALGLSGCDDHDHDHGTGSLQVHIKSPINNSTVSNAAQTTIEVHFMAEHELEQVEVRLLVDSSNTVVSPFPITGHEHKQEHTIMETVNLSSYAPRTRFRIEAKACKNHDDNCADFVQEIARFTLP